MKTRIVATWLAVTLLAGIARAEDKTKADPREKLETAVPEAIRLLEKKEYKTFLKQFVSPKALERMLKDEELTLEELAAKFAVKKTDPLLDVLKAIEKVKPTLQDDGKTAKFYLPKPGIVNMSIKFYKVGKYWYIGN